MNYYSNYLSIIAAVNFVKNESINHFQLPFKIIQITNKLEQNMSLNTKISSLYQTQIAGETLFKRKSVAQACAISCMMAFSSLALPVSAVEIEYTDSTGTLQTTPNWGTADTGELNKPNGVFPGSTASPLASNNTVTIDYTNGSKTKPNYVYGGLATGANAAIQNNTVNLVRGDVGTVRGAYIYNQITNTSDSTSMNLQATDNTVNVYTGIISSINGASIIGYTAGAGNIQAHSSNNQVNFYGGTANSTTAASVRATGTNNLDLKVNNNTVNMLGGTVNSYFYGATIQGIIKNGTGNVTALGTNNTLNISDVTLSSRIYGAWITTSKLSDYGTGDTSTTAIQNTVNITNSTTTNISTAGYVSGRDFANANLNASNNAINITNSSINSAYGGWISEFSNTGSVNLQANNNTVTISGGSVTGDLIGSYIETNGSGSKTIQAINNTVNIAGAPIFNANSNIYGGYISNIGGTIISSDRFTGNTLNFSAEPITARNISGFENYNFVIPASAVDGTVLINAGGTVDVDNSKVEVKGIASGSPLQAGEQVVLINAATLTGTAQTVDSRVLQGISLYYDIDVEQSGNQITATILDHGTIVTPPGPNPGETPPLGTSPGPAQVNPQTKALSEGRLAGLALAIQGADNVTSTNWLQDQEDGTFQPFITTVGGHNRYNTGSHVDLDSINILGGIGYKHNQWGVAGFIEGGWGNYDSYNSFTNATNVHGNGNTHYYGVGLLGRYELTDQLYLDGSVRIGTSQTDFKSQDLVSASGQHAQYDSKSNYASAHIGVGYQLPINESTQTDLSIKYLWTHLGSDSVTVVGDPIDFDSINSHRVRATARVYHDVNPQLALRGGLGYEYELDGKANATTYHVYNIDSPSLEGGSGIGEIGLTYTPTANQNLTLDFGVRGYVGQREGVNGTFQITYKF